MINDTTMLTLTAGGVTACAVMLAYGWRAYTDTQYIKAVNQHMAKAQLIPWCQQPTFRLRKGERPLVQVPGRISLDGEYPRNGLIAVTNMRVVFHDNSAPPPTDDPEELLFRSELLTKDDIYVANPRKVYSETISCTGYTTIPHTAVKDDVTIKRAGRILTMTGVNGCKVELTFDRPLKPIEAVVVLLAQSIEYDNVYTKTHPTAGADRD